MKKQRLLLLMGAALLSTGLLFGCNNAKQEAAPQESTAPQQTEEAAEETPAATQEAAATFESQELQIENEGRTIPATLVTPTGKENYPLVVMNHGFGGSRNENGGFTKIAETLAEQGIASIRMDFAGCGDSTADFVEYSLKNNISDVNACLSYALNNASIDKENIGVFGYSMGGALAVLLTEYEDNPYKAMVLLAPGVNRNMDFFADIDSNLKEANEKGYYAMDWFGSELHVGADFYQGVKDAFDVFEKYDNTRDCVVIYGDQDTTVLPEYSKAFADQMDVESVLIEGADHGYGFYSDQPDVTQKLLDTVTSFYTKEFGL